LFNPVENIKMGEKIEEQIRTAIFTEKLKEGDKLPSEEELSKIFNASRTTVRQAKRVLEKEGLISIKQGVTGGTFIREMNASPVIASISSMLKFKRITLEDITEARLVIEPEVAKLAAQRRTKEDIANLEDALNGLSRVVQEKRRATSTNLQFHRIIAESAKSPVLFFISEALMNLLLEDLGTRYLDLDQNRLLLKQHTEIFQAIKLQQPENACVCLRDHIVFVKKIMKPKK
jgi:GntR family transcriptional repressor for pyruvate dehydrogenase complex